MENCLVVPSEISFKISAHQAQDNIPALLFADHGTYSKDIDECPFALSNSQRPDSNRGSEHTQNLLPKSPGQQPCRTARERSSCLRRQSANSSQTRREMRDCSRKKPLSSKDRGRLLKHRAKSMLSCRESQEAVLGITVTRRMRPAPTL